MKIERSPQPELSINLTPLIDVVFLLLIFFMVTTSFKSETDIKLELPQVSESKRDVQEKSLRILISRSGQYSINGSALSESNLAALKGKLREQMANQDELPVQILADANTPHQAVVTAMEAAGAVGLSRVQISTQVNPSL